jgi:hypothetical protein
MVAWENELLTTPFLGAHRCMEGICFVVNGCPVDGPTRHFHILTSSVTEKLKGLSSRRRTSVVFAEDSEFVAIFPAHLPKLAQRGGVEGYRKSLKSVRHCAYCSIQCILQHTVYTVDNSLLRS